MRRVTVTLDEKVADWAHARARREGLSLSRFLDGLLYEKMREYERAMERFFAIKPRNLSDGNSYPARAELHDRKNLR